MSFTPAWNGLAAVPGWDIPTVIPGLTGTPAFTGYWFPELRYASSGMTEALELDNSFTVIPA